MRLVRKKLIGYEHSDISNTHGSGRETCGRHCEFSSLDAAHYAGLGDETYHNRSVVKSVIRSLKRQFGDTLQA